MVLKKKEKKNREKVKWREHCVSFNPCVKIVPSLFFLFVFHDDNNTAIIIILLMLLT